MDTEGKKVRSGNRNYGDQKKTFILTYGIPLMYGGTLHKDLVTLADKTSTKKILSGEYYLPVNAREHVKVTLEIILHVSEKMKSRKLAISISTPDYIK